MPKHSYNYKGRSQNVLAFERSAGREEDISNVISDDLAAGQSLAAKNRGKALDERTMRLYETRLMHLEEFAASQGDNAVLFGEGKRPFLAVTIMTFLQKKSERKGKKIGSLRCEGLKPPVLNGYKAAFRYWFNAFGHAGPYEEIMEKDDEGKVVSITPSGNPMLSPGVKQTIKQLIKRAKRPSQKETRRGRKAYEPKKAPPFLLDDLYRMRNYCFATIEGLRGLWLWTITLFSFGLFLRGEEPLRLKVKHLSFPDGFDPQSDNIPHRIEVRIPFSKADRQAKGVTLTLWSNPLDQKLCPVTALLSWFMLTGITKGLIFPRVARNNLGVSSSRGYHGVSSYRKTFSQMCQHLFGKPYTTHSIRRSAAQWAARCGADDSTIKRAGRWKSNSFELYTQDARAEIIKLQHDNQPSNDHKKWMFKPLR